MTPRLALVDWRPCWRIIPSRFPPAHLFERVADAADLEAIFEIDSMTNPRLRDEAGEIRLVPREDRVAGPGASVIMAPFTHLNPEGSRFSDGTFGVFYAARDLDTAIAESVHHRIRFLRATMQPGTELDMRVYLVDLAGNLHDLRGRQSAFPLVYRDDSYRTGQNLARELRGAASNGIAYHSLRNDGGECAGVFRPRLLSSCRQERHLCYVWDGQEIVDIYEKRALKN